MGAGLTYSDCYQSPERAERYEKEIYRPGSPPEVIWRVEQRLLRRLLAAHLPRLERVDALDFACGFGRITGFLRPLVRSVIGVDISEHMLARARRNVPGASFMHADIVADPDSVPGDKDLVTAFRFLLLAEPALREAVVRELTHKLRDRDSIMIFSLHGNPRSYRAVASLRNRLVTRRRPPLPGFGMRDMRRLADRCGLRIVGATGCGFLPNTFARFASDRFYEAFERTLAGRRLLWGFGSNLLVVCRRQ